MDPGHTPVGVYNPNPSGILAAPKVIARSAVVILNKSALDKHTLGVVL